LRNTLGVAQYRRGNWAAAIEALTKSMELYAATPEEERWEAASTYFLAMAHWQLGHRDEARPWYDRAVRWMEKYKPHDEELHRFRAEAKALLGLDQGGVSEVSRLNQNERKNTGR